MRGRPPSSPVGSSEAAAVGTLPGAGKAAAVDTAVRNPAEDSLAGEGSPRGSLAGDSQT